MLNRHTPPPIQPTSLDFRKPVQRVLRNGIPLHVIEAGQLDAVRIDFVFSAGQWHQEHKLQALFACRMLREGCRGYTSAEFAERLDYYGAWLDLSVAMNRTFVTLYTLKKHFATTLELVHRMLTEPSYSEEQFRIVCDNNKAQLMVNLQKGDVQAMRALRRSLYGEEHPCGKPMWWTSTTDIMVRAPAAYTSRVMWTSPYWRVWSRSSAWQSGGVERKWKVESGEMKVIAIWMRTILFHL